MQKYLCGLLLLGSLGCGSSSTTPDSSSSADGGETADAQVQISRQDGSLSLDGSVSIDAGAGDAGQSGCQWTVESQRIDEDWVPQQTDTRLTLVRHPDAWIVGTRGGLVAVDTSGERLAHAKFDSLTRPAHYFDVLIHEGDMLTMGAAENGPGYHVSRVRWDGQAFTLVESDYVNTQVSRYGKLIYWKNAFWMHTEGTRFWKIVGIQPNHSIHVTAADKIDSTISNMILETREMVTTLIRENDPGIYLQKFDSIGTLEDETPKVAEASYPEARIFYKAPNYTIIYPKNEGFAQVKVSKRYQITQPEQIIADKPHQPAHLLAVEKGPTDFGLLRFPKAASGNSGLELVLWSDSSQTQQTITIDSHPCQYPTADLKYEQGSWNVAYGCQRGLYFAQIRCQ